MSLKSISVVMILSLFTFQWVIAQKTMDYTTFDIWNTIKDVKISNNGDWVAYNISPGKGDPTLYLFNTRTLETYDFERAKSHQFDFDNNFLVFKIHPPLDTIESLKRKDTKTKDLPKDTLGIFHLDKTELEKIENVKSFKLAKEFGQYLVYLQEPDKDKKDTTKVTVTAETKKDSTKTKAKPRKESADNGSMLTIRNIKDKTKKSFPFVKEYHLAQKAPYAIFLSTGTDTLEQDKIMQFDFKMEKLNTISSLEGDYKNMVINDQGTAITYMLNQDTTDIQIDPFDLYIWQNNQSKIVAKHQDQFMTKDWILNEHEKPEFSEDGDRLFFGIQPKPLLQDTSKLDDEIVNVEIWNYQDQVLYTTQEVREDRDKKKAYDCIYNLNTKSVLQLGSLEIPKMIFDRKKMQDVAIGINDDHYQKYVSWEGHDYNDIYTVDLKTGKSEKILDKIYGNISLSPFGKYGYWYDRADSSWFAIQLDNKKVTTMTSSEQIFCADELNDRPMDAWDYGNGPWLEEDEALIIYDRYDLWMVYPNNQKKNKRLTKGRESKTIHRYINLDREIEALPKDTTILIHQHNEENRSEAYSYLNIKTGEISEIMDGECSFTRRIYKAKNSDDIIYTKQTLDEFPNLIYSNLKSFKDGMKITNANPQQKDYQWGDVELVNWKDKYGIEHTGMLFTPEGLDKKKKHPLIVNFYERSSQGLHRHRAPYPHRSTINYSYYLSKGYVIFNPDISYRIGEPGDSCVDIVMSGVDHVLTLGFVDESKMGVQGHSWGGYQIAHLLTKTNRFACAESGAPVVNMVSAYGGIRWGSGMSRMFQYEHTQSRLGASLWENPQAYLDNSPIFNIDKVETPVLILHNDKDGAVPWYQGIEFFVAMRRLGKKAWMLNYNAEPHWPLKRQNRVDFNRRMEQFFDHYLLGATMPEWMDKGVPAKEKSINLGY